jgi:hypothetical protein
MDRKLLDKMETFVYLQQNSNLKDVPKTFHTIILKEDILNYKTNQKYTASFDVLIYLRFLQVEYDICELDTTKPIISKYVLSGDAQ